MNTVNSTQQQQPSFENPSIEMVIAGIQAAATYEGLRVEEAVKQVYLAMREQFHKEEAAKALVGITPELEELLRITTITTKSNEKFIVNDRTLRVEDSEDGRLIEERPLLGREGQLIAGIMYLQRLNENHMTLDRTHEREYIMNHPGEPHFVLLGRDVQAPALVRKWAGDRSEIDPADPKIDDAYTRALAMETYKRNAS